MNNNTMNNNINNYDNTMNDSNEDSSSILVAEAVLCTPTQKHQPGTLSALYKLAARNLREYHGVPSMTALKLEKTVALLGLRPRRMVVQGLAPRRLIIGGEGGSSPLVLAGDSSDETGELVSENLDISSSEDELEGEDDSNNPYDDNIYDNFGDYSSSDDTKGNVEGFEADVNGYGNGKTRRPIHAALVAGGINLRPREARPLLCALGVGPRRLVTLGLVKREAVRAMPGGRGGGRDQHLRTSRAGKRDVGGARGPSCGPPRAYVGPSPGCGSFGPMHGPLRRHFHGAGRHSKQFRGEESEEEGMSAAMGPHGGPGHCGPLHHRGCLQGPPRGPGHHSMPTIRYSHGPPGGDKHGHGHSHPRHGHGHGHGGGLHGEGGRDGGERLRGGRAGGPGQHGSRHRGGGVGRRGPSRSMHGPPYHPFHGAGHDAVRLGEESEEEGMFMSLGSHGGPRHRGPRHTGRGGTGRSCGRPTDRSTDPFTDCSTKKVLLEHHLA